MSPPSAPTPVPADSRLRFDAGLDPRRLLDCVEDAILVVDKDFHILYANTAVLAFLADGAAADTSPADIDPLAAIHPDDLEDVMVRVTDLMAAPGAKDTVRMRVRENDGWRPVEAVINNLIDDDAIGGVVVCFRNLTAEEQYRRNLEIQLELDRHNRALRQQLQERQRFLGRLVRIQSSISRRAPISDVLNAVVDGAHQLLGDEVVGLRLRDPADPSRLVLAAWHGFGDNILAGQRSVPATVGIGGLAYTKNRLVVTEDYGAFEEPIEAFVESGLRAGLAVPIRNGDLAVGSLTIGSYDPNRRFSATEQEMLLSLAEHASIALMDAHTVESMEQALTDLLTGLPNRRLLIDRLTQSIERSRRRNEPLAVLFVDLDGFKAINDGRGHAAGDAVLVEVARRITASIRPDDTASRLGGDEFIVTLENTDGHHANAVAQRLLESIQQRFKIEGRTFFVGATIGVALIDTDSIDAEMLVRQADIAMYRGKEQGRGRVVFFEPTMEEAVVARARLEGELREAIRYRRLEVAFQPVVDLRTGAVHGVEALARWTSRSQGPIDALKFIELAEQMGMISELDQAVLRLGCRAVRDIVDPVSGLPLVLNVNLSPQFLDSPDLVSGIRDALAELEFPAERLVVEITETEAMRDPVGAVDRLAALKALGVRLAIDDFGTGYSSLAYLERFPIDVVKVDREFIAGIDTPTRGSHLTESMIRLAHNMGLVVVAEGVETESQAAALRALGTDLGQGYHFSRPVPADQLQATLDKLRIDAVTPR